MMDDPENPGGRVAIVQEISPEGEVVSKAIAKMREDPENPENRMATVEEVPIQ